MNFLTLFAGGGLADIGIRNAGHRTLYAIERERWIADNFALNFPETNVICGDATQIDYGQFSGIDAIWASPPCQNFSNARDKSLPDHKDANASYCLIDAVKAINPRYLFIENVPQYAGSKVWDDVRSQLWELGYFIQENVLNAADFGVPQNRKRWFCFAVNNSKLPIIPQKSRKIGWYEAVKDLIPECPITELANWQKNGISRKYLDNKPIDLMLVNSQNSTGSPFKIGDTPSHTVTTTANQFRCLIPRDGARSQSFRLINQTEPSPTLRALGHDGHCRQFDLFDGYEVRQLTPRCEARLQTLPDSYQFGNLSNWKQKKIIGNGVPCLLVEQLLRGLD